MGKTWLVRELARQAGRPLIEVNLERDPRLARCFSASDPRRILDDLSLEMGRDLDDSRDILFIDEVQAEPDVLKSLRWFREELPGLPVITAGSLLEFALAALRFSMPVGRIGHRYLEPVGFEEFLMAHRQERLLARLRAWVPGDQSLDASAHEQATGL